MYEGARKTGPTRLQKIADSKALDYFMMCVIVVSAVELAMTAAEPEPRGPASSRGARRGVLGARRGVRLSSARVEDTPQAPQVDAVRSRGHHLPPLLLRGRAQDRGARARLLPGRLEPHRLRSGPRGSRDAGRRPRDARAEDNSHRGNARRC